MTKPSYDMSANKLQTFIETHLPLAQAADLNVKAYDGEVLQLSAPLALNDNDKGTAFGGSIYNTMVLTGWGMTYINVNELGLDGDLVIAKAEIEYLRPLREDIVASVERPSEEDLKHFKDAFEKHGKASLHHQVVVKDSAGKACAKFHGKYAIVPRN